MNILILGGVAAGTKTAAKLKREEPEPERYDPDQGPRTFPTLDAAYPIMWAASLRTGRS